MRYTGPQGKKARRLGQAFTKKEAVVLDRRQAPPGQHGKGKGRPSEYSLQMREKQRAKHAYGVAEGQFYRMFLSAQKQVGSAGDNLLKNLELRLDNVVYRLGFAVTRRQARQMVSHSFFTLNGKKASVPSIAVKPGDVVELKESKKKGRLYEEMKAMLESASVPDWLSVNAKEFSGKVLSLPNPKDHAEQISSQQIVEHYQRI